MGQMGPTHAGSCYDMASGQEAIASVPSCFTGQSTALLLVPSQIPFSSPVITPLPAQQKQTVRGRYRLHH
jgi:hypothetical protein